MDHGVKKLKRSRIPIVKVRWEGKRGAEFTWEREDQMKLNRLRYARTVLYCIETVVGRRQIRQVAGLWGMPYTYTAIGVMG
ncbi:hypothetical protein E3N88_25970 [Mikania micrantha]|uniref:Reverse transcriptase domain-containing protein n=1 Tax=Mikania micrantha TaxID=192012 RepID=A0A5N6N902_9ASTR|nr:hypothetical protein E3N88_25970 [Mikania micrantha]